MEKYNWAAMINGKLEQPSVNKEINNIATTQKSLLDWPVRVMFISSGMNRGGAESLLLDVVNNLDRKRFQPMLCIYHQGELIKEVREDVPVFSELAVWAGDLKGLPRLIRLLRQQKPIIVDVFNRDDAGLYGRLAAKVTGVPLIVQSLHTGRFRFKSDPKRMAHHFMNRFADLWTKAYITVSKHQEVFYREMGLPAEKLITIKNGINLSKFHPSDENRRMARECLGIKQDIPVIGMVANFSRVKRHDILLHAMTFIKKEAPNIKCLLIGDGSLRSAMEKLAETLGLSDEVRFLGLRSDVPELLSALDVFVLSSDSESFSNSILEAMATGLPVVSTNCGGPEEIVIEGKTGYLVPVAEPIELAKKIIYLIKKPQLSHQFGADGRLMAFQDFSLEKMVSTREKEYEQLLNSITP